jgi:hypothetical protein
VRVRERNAAIADVQVGQIGLDAFDVRLYNPLSPIRLTMAQWCSSHAQADLQFSLTIDL